jgi:hypothetical protein
MRHAAWLLAVVLVAGCAAPSAGPSDGGDGATATLGPSSTAGGDTEGAPGTGGTAGPFLLVVLWNKDFFGSEEEVRKDRYDTVDDGGRMFHFIAMPSDGTGRLTGPDSAFLNVTRAESAAHLQAIGRWNASRDLAVETAWRAAIPQAELDDLRTVLEEERELPEDTSPYRVGCADGGSALIKVSAPEGDWERTIGCLGNQSQTESDSGNRILQAFYRARQAARATLDEA